MIAYACNSAIIDENDEAVAADNKRFGPSTTNPRVTTRAVGILAVS